MWVEFLLPTPGLGCDSGGFTINPDLNLSFSLGFKLDPILSLDWVGFEEGIEGEK